MNTIFDISRPGRGAWAQHPRMEEDQVEGSPECWPSAQGAQGAASAAADQGQMTDGPASALAGLPAEALRETPPRLPEVSELQAVRHYTNLSAKNAAIDNRFYPLGSCTMKYNPRGAHRAASLPGFLDRHPLRPERASQGFLGCLFQLQEMLKEATGAEAMSLAPMAGAQGEFAGVAMIRAYHRARGEEGAPRNPGARGCARHQSGHRRHVRLPKCGKSPWTHRGMWIWRRSRRRWARAPPG